MVKKTYLAGPMAGYDNYNFPAFDHAAAWLRQNRWQIVSPAEIDRLYGDVGEASWGECLARDVRIIADECDSMIFLPGWQESRGARLEALTGLLNTFRFFTYTPWQEQPVAVIAVHTVLDAIERVTRAKIFAGYYRQAFKFPTPQEEVRTVADARPARGDEASGSPLAVARREDVGQPV